ncbi:AbrB/MazE/SpoVT family DNA-binding domain-containing protein [Microbacterium sp. NPDC089698]|jgi:AbrB family looped-hinge helix DNA binding protein|uniref:AbrB/MazE/SpoVT family DNA-binding domain-containing protein n=1 Tax=unclassified Microbacterium TaxID=2609290 RepID=UPI00282BEE9B|nr:AbrB/MazE/SpoVT family DNA-binding domain-containing protein [Microbacterium sp.]MDR2320493.1 AbrB/MazE/SpoVT family DNA-binding domain-containing protein [Microbacterium sp.]
MSTTYAASMGDRGRLVVPAGLRERQHWESGTALLFIETENGVVLATREQAKRIVRAQLSGQDLVQQLLDERRAAAGAEDAA